MEEGLDELPPELSEPSAIPADAGRPPSSSGTSQPPWISSGPPLALKPLVPTCAKPVQEATLSVKKETSNIVIGGALLSYNDVSNPGSCPIQIAYASYDLNYSARPLPLSVDDKGDSTSGSECGPPLLPLPFDDSASPTSTDSPAPTTTLFCQQEDEHWVPDLTPASPTPSTTLLCPQEYDQWVPNLKLPLPDQTDAPFCQQEDEQWVTDLLPALVPSMISCMPGELML